MGWPVVIGTVSVADTRAVAGRLAALCAAGDVVLLVGELGAGKTAFVRGAAAALGVRDQVTSPTFTLAHFYPFGHGTILHVDAYRLSGVLEYRDLGLDDYLEDSVTLIEWGEKIADDFSCHLMVEFQGDPSAPDLRVIAFSSGCPRWRPVIDALQAALLDETKLS